MSYDRDEPNRCIAQAVVRPHVDKFSKFSLINVRYSQPNGMSPLAIVDRNTRI